MRKERGIDHRWQIRKYCGNIALFAHCKCGFEYPCSSNKRNSDGTFSFEQEIIKLYSYCPCCGARKKWYNDIPKNVNKFPYDG